LLETFAGELEADFEHTLNRFLSLQVQGSRDAGDVLRQLRAAIRRCGQPQPLALRAGLAILRDSDLRSACADVTCPALVLAGERDTLVPASAAAATAALLPQARAQIITGAGHAPFLSAPEEVAAAIREFLLAAELRTVVDSNV
jgi:pimeloyl-[acyl-carrier protein] methyl ester esterase